MGVVTMAGHTLTDYARGGAAVEAVWIAAEQHGIGIQPVSPVFLYAHDDGDLAELAAEHVLRFAPCNSSSRPDRHRAHRRAGLVLRFIHAPKPSVRSRRRPMDGERIDERPAPPRQPVTEVATRLMAATSATSAGGEP